MAKTTKKESKQATSVKPFDLVAVMKKFMGKAPKDKDIEDDKLPKTKVAKNKLNKKGVIK